MKLYIMDNGWNENDLACLVAMPHQACLLYTSHKL